MVSTEAAYVLSRKRSLSIKGELKMLKKLFSTLIIIVIIFSGVASYSLDTQSSNKCKQNCANACQCDKSKTKEHPKGNACTCLTECPSTIPCCLTFSYGHSDKYQLERITHLSSDITLVFLSTFHFIEYQPILPKPFPYISNPEDRAPPSYPFA